MLKATKMLKKPSCELYKSKLKLKATENLETIESEQQQQKLNGTGDISSSEKQLQQQQQQQQQQQPLKTFSLKGNQLSGSILIGNYNVRDSSFRLQ